jgi:hypothetical protein
VESVSTVHLNSGELEIAHDRREENEVVVAWQLPFPTFVIPQVWPQVLMGPTKIKMGLKHNQT